MQKLKTQNGITLIALIITIIVMLILVAVTLVITLGDNGIIAKAREAKNTQALRQEAENLELGANAGDNINALVENGTPWNLNTSGEKPKYYVSEAEGLVLEVKDESNLQNATLYLINGDETVSEMATVGLVMNQVNFDWEVKDYTLSNPIDLGSIQLPVGTVVKSFAAGEPMQVEEFVYIPVEEFNFIYGDMIYLWIGSGSEVYVLDPEFELGEIVPIPEDY